MSPVTVHSPLEGQSRPLAETPDPMFAGGFVGPGVMVDPPRGPTVAVAPIDGTMVKMHPHAFIVLHESGASVLVHLGIDTVQLKGEGFTLHVKEGDTVTAGQQVVSWNPAEIEAGGKSPASPVVALEGAPEQLSDVVDSGQVAAGQPLFTWNR
jgi:glucose-specific phosphotransferase system IIA component